MTVSDNSSRRSVFNDSAQTEISAPSLHDALPILAPAVPEAGQDPEGVALEDVHLLVLAVGDRKSTRLNSSHLGISYAVFCLKKKKTTSTKPTYAFISGQSNPWTWMM